MCIMTSNITFLGSLDVHKRPVLLLGPNHKCWHRCSKAKIAVFSWNFWFVPTISPEAWHGGLEALKCYTIPAFSHSLHTPGIWLYPIQAHTPKSMPASQSSSPDLGDCCVSLSHSLAVLSLHRLSAPKPPSSDLATQGLSLPLFSFLLPGCFW
jgi:hypothetical protein